MKKTAIVLLNLGGPDELSSVKPFLFNLFNDPAIITLPQPFRFLLAKFISFARTRKAKAIYQKIGGKSPILEQTQAQAAALEKLLAGRGQFKVFVCMRHWHPMSEMVAKNVKNFAPDHVILLPMYPQFSTTTTGSAFADWKRSAAAAGLDVPTSRICCYPGDLSFVAAHVKMIRDAYWKAAEHGKPRVLFSAHGLPKKIVKAGDPYQWQVEHSVAQIVQILATDDLDWRTCYQSRVGKLAWIGPSTEEEIQKAGADKLPLVIVPVSFVSEHSETLVELDMDYRALAEEAGVPNYQRVPALACEPMFIDALAGLCDVPLGKDVCSFTDGRFCPPQFKQCPHAA